MDKADAAMETVKQIIRKLFGCDADEIGKKTNATNNSVHGIGIKNYGYIGRGVACYDSLIDFFEDDFDRFDTALKDAVSEIQLKKLNWKHGNGKLFQKLSLRDLSGYRTCRETHNEE